MLRKGCDDIKGVAHHLYQENRQQGSGKHDPRKHSGPVEVVLPREGAPVLVAIAVECLGEEDQAADDEKEDGLGVNVFPEPDGEDQTEEVEGYQTPDPGLGPVHGGAECPDVLDEGRRRPVRLQHQSSEVLLEVGHKAAEARLVAAAAVPRHVGGYWAPVGETRTICG